MNIMEVPALAFMGLGDEASSQVSGKMAYTGDQPDKWLETLDAKINHLNAEIDKSMLDIPSGSPTAALDFLSSVLHRKDLVGLVTASVGGVINSYNRLSQMFS